MGFTLGWAEEVAQADGLLGQVVGLQAKALTILEKAEKDDDLRTALMAVREAGATMELVAKITGELVHKQETSLKTDVQWTFVIGEGYVDNDEWDRNKRPYTSSRSSPAWRPHQETATPL